MISQDPFGSVAGAVEQHATEVEPDSFSFGRTTVTAFQTGRVPDGGATDIGFTVSDNGGQTWAHGFLPAVTTAATPPGPYLAASDASVAFDSKHNARIISYLGITSGNAVDVVVSRSTDGGHTWGAPMIVDSTGEFFDKNWTACDNSPSSPFFGNCYTEFGRADRRPRGRCPWKHRGPRSGGRRATVPHVVPGAAQFPERIVTGYPSIRPPPPSRFNDAADPAATTPIVLVLAAVTPVMP